MSYWYWYWGIKPSIIGWVFNVFFGFMRCFPLIGSSWLGLCLLPMWSSRLVEVIVLLMRLGVGRLVLVAAVVYLLTYSLSINFYTYSSIYLRAT